MSVQTEKESAALVFLYRTVPGRALLKLLIGRGLSQAAGRFLSSPLSKPLIDPFVRKNGIALGDYTGSPYACFNDFFCRPIRPGKRPLPDDPADLMAPCDGLLSAYRITEGTVLPVKQSRYTVSELLGLDMAARRFHDGVCLVFRLCVDNYHRYCYVDDGQKGPNVFLPGVLHTVRPIALESVPVFVRNCREYTLMETAHFGSVAQVEVGALLVGRIDNRQGAGPMRRGEEKGRFLYGGSTVVLLLEKDRVRVNDALFEATARGIETPVLMGQVLGHALSPAD
ncbi:MAG: phosphatidylserine decarboxylase [Oscillospiraceae bacterium]|nr:phosphatidylserine decarboxylase [Oscillospiraceae bacterium]